MISAGIEPKLEGAVLSQQIASFLDSESQVELPIAYL